MGYLFAWLGSPTWLYPSQNLVHLQSIHWRAEWRTDKVLMQCKSCSAIAKTLIYYQYCFGCGSKAQHHTSCYQKINSITARHSTPRKGQHYTCISCVIWTRGWYHRKPSAAGRYDLSHKVHLWEASCFLKFSSFLFCFVFSREVMFWGLLCLGWDRILKI